MFLIIKLFILLQLSVNSSYEKVYHIHDFGAVGDGIHNDYPAFQRATEAINQNGGGILKIPKGIYFLDAYNHGKQKKNLVFKNLNHFTIQGEKGAIISLKGNFHRTKTKVGKKHSFSNISSLIGITIRNSKNVEISDIEIDGNVDQMTRDKGVVEAAGHGLMLIDNEHVNLKNIYTHHHMADGLNIKKRDKLLTNRDYKIDHVISKYNGRQGLTIGGLDDAVFTNCEFSYTGITGGNYGRHAPSAGLDIEPIHGHKVNNVTFKNCIFKENQGSEIVVSHVSTTSNINFEACTFESSDDSNRKYEIIVNAKEVNFYESVFDLKKGSIYPTWKNRATSARFYNCTIKSNFTGMLAVNYKNEAELVVKNCQFIYTGLDKIKSYFPYIRMQGVSFEDNEIYIPSDKFKEKGVSGFIQNAKLIKNLKIKSSDPNKKPKISLQGSTVL